MGFLCFGSVTKCHFKIIIILCRCCDVSHFTKIYMIRMESYCVIAYFELLLFSCDPGERGETHSTHTLQLWSLLSVMKYFMDARNNAHLANEKILLAADVH